MADPTTTNPEDIDPRDIKRAALEVEEARKSLDSALELLGEQVDPADDPAKSSDPAAHAARKYPREAA